MKIKKCYISSFGKLKDFSIEFNDELTVINHENGWGKSTLASFIKAIFYGLNDGKRSVAENERTKYKPWNSTERFGGYAIIERSGSEYKIERYFGNKQSEDSVTVTEVATGKTFSTIDLGKKFFQIDEEGFLSTTYFTQKDFEIKSNPSITAKFNETYEVSDPEAYEKTLSNLEGKAKEYKMKGDKGKISDLKREIRETQEKIEGAKLSSITAEKLKKEGEILLLEKQDLEKEIARISEKIAMAGRKEASQIKKQNHAKLKDEYAKLANKIKKEKGLLDNNERKAKLATNYFECVKDVEKLSVMESGLVANINQLESLSMPQAIKKDNKPMLFCVLSCFFILMALVLFFINPIIGGILLVPSIVFGALFLVKQGKNQDSGSQKSDLENIILSKKQELNSIKELKEKNTKALNDYLSLFAIEYSDFEQGLKEVEKLYNALSEDLINLNKISTEIEKIEKDEEVFKDYSLVEDLSLLRQKLSLLNAEYSEKTNALAQKRARFNTHQAEGERLREYQENLSDLKEKLSAYLSEYEVLCLTIDFLKKADENLKVKYRTPLQEGISKFIKYVDDKNLEVNIDVDLKVSAISNGQTKDVDYYSKGYRNLIEICKRFALIEVLFTSDKPFIILDDPFVNLDGAKLQSALNLIKNLSKEYQIIYFICHDSRSAK